MTSLKHEVTQIADGVWCLSEFRLVNAFLVEGRDRAALIDTGCGIGKLHETVRGLTGKPLVILLTHAHFDHDGGVKQFPGVPVWLHPADGALQKKTLEMMQKQMGVSDLNALRRYYIKTRAPIRCPEADIDALLSLVPDAPCDALYGWQPLADGTEIDLGGRVLKALHTPGHTDGEMCFLDEASRTLFSGDTANVGIILARQPDGDTRLIRVVRATMEKLWALREKYDRLGVGHDAVTIPRQIIRDYLTLATGLLDGSITGAYEETGFRKGEVARLGLAELWYQCDQ